jgi:hypothetical protein
MMTKGVASNCQIRRTKEMTSKEVGSANHPIKTSRSGGDGLKRCFASTPMSCFLSGLDCYDCTGLALLAFNYSRL